VTDDQSIEPIKKGLTELNGGVDRAVAGVEDDLQEFQDSIRQQTVESVKERLVEFETSIERIPSLDAPPRTTLQVQNRADVEDAWQSYLGYFLNPNAPHGLGKDVLHRFLAGLDEVAVESFPTHLSDNIVVEEEVSSPNDNRPDLVIQTPGEFFICCELKLYSSEGEHQTERYASDSHIGAVQKSRFPEEGHHYVYIRRPGHKTADSEAFVDVTWTQVRDWIEPLVLKNRGRYPARTIAQLTDFLDTIQHDMTQNEHIKTAQEKMRLYFNHEDAIREAKHGLDTVYDYELDNWRRRFRDEYLPENWGPDWHTNPDRNGQIYHRKWRQDERLAIDDSQIRMHFVHLIRDKSSFTDGELTMQLRWPGESPYRKQFKELFVSDQFADQLDTRLGEYNIDKLADYGYSNPRFTEKVYSVVKPELPDSYYETLQVATREHLHVAPVINDILETAIKEVEADK
jgi:hypothetical protein